MTAGTQRVLVTGAAGVMGVRLVRRLVEGGRSVRALVLPRDPLRARLDGLECEIREGDVSALDSLSGLCNDIDTVCHLAGVILSHDPGVFGRVNREGTANLVALAAAAKVRHFIYVSSASVTYPRRTPYADSKWDAEQLILREGAFEHTIVRPTLAYDESGGQEFLMFRDYLRRFAVVPFIGTGRAMKRPVWTGDIVDGLVRLVGNPVSYGKTYNFSGGEPISMIDFARLILRHDGSKKRFVHVPVPVCRVLASLLRVFSSRPPLTANAIAGVVNDANLDPCDAMRDLGYRPLGVREGFLRCFPQDALGSVPGAPLLHPSPSTERHLP